MLGGDGKGVEDIRQEMGFVNWNASISPFTASMAMSMDVSEHTRSSGALRGFAEGWESVAPWGRKTESRDEQQPNPPEAKSLFPYCLRFSKDMALSYSRNHRILPFVCK